MLKEALDKVSIHQLTRLLRDRQTVTTALPNKVRVYVLRNHTIDNLSVFLVAMGMLHDIDIQYVQGDYDTIEQEIVNLQSPLYQFNPDIIICSLVLENFFPAWADNTFTVQDVTDRLGRMLQVLRLHSTAMIVGNTFLLPLYSWQGIHLGHSADALDQKIRAINSWYQQFSQQITSLYVIDWNHIEQRLGSAQSRDVRFWYIAKSILSNVFMKEYASEILKLALAIKGKIKKCLILDCDNTLWGGVIGEDGLDQIQLGPHDYPGNIYYDFQKTVLSLVKRGVMVALCSKNNEGDVLEVLDKHPQCLIKRNHLVGWRINWEDKVSNLRALAKQFNIGLDSFVFVDDSPTECAFIRQHLPEVTVRMVSENKFEYPSLLLKEGLFDALGGTDEDVHRVIMMKTEQQRQQESVKHDNLNDFLCSLQLSATIAPVSKEQVARVAQLTQKTNQFNLTTRRYSAIEVNVMIEDPQMEVLYLSLSDRFGDYGIVGLSIIKYEGSKAYLDTFLLSCRVLGRKIEDVFLMASLSKVAKRGYEQLTSEYIPTLKNGQVSRFFDGHGFQLSQDQQGLRQYEYAMTQFKMVRPEFYKNIIIT